MKIENVYYRYVIFVIIKIHYCHKIGSRYLENESVAKAHKLQICYYTIYEYNSVT